jgi:hypothetical protein
MHGVLQATDLYFWWEPKGSGERVVLSDHHAARAYLARLDTRGNAAALRRLAASDPLTAPRIEAGALLDQLATWLVSGKLRLAVSSLPPLWARDGDVAETPPPEIPWDAPAPEDPRRIEQLDALPPDTVDMLLQAAVLKKAAREGIPFCEECEKKKKKRAKQKQEAEDAARLDQASQAATLQRAARAGTPFCEECEKREPAR